MHKLKHFQEILLFDRSSRKKLFQNEIWSLSFLDFKLKFMRKS